MLTKDRLYVRLRKMKADLSGPALGVAGGAGEHCRAAGEYAGSLDMHTWARISPLDFYQ